MERPPDIVTLAPMYERENLYRVLRGPHGSMLHDIASRTPPCARDFRYPLATARLRVAASRGRSDRKAAMRVSVSPAFQRQCAGAHPDHPGRAEPVW